MNVATLSLISANGTIIRTLQPVGLRMKPAKGQRVRGNGGRCYRRAFPMSPPFGRAARGAEDPQDFDAIFADPIGDEISGLRHDKLAGPRHAAGTADRRAVGEPSDRTKD